MAALKYIIAVLAIVAFTLMLFYTTSDLLTMIIHRSIRNEKDRTFAQRIRRSIPTFFRALAWVVFNICFSVLIWFLIVSPKHLGFESIGSAPILVMGLFAMIIILSSMSARFDMSLRIAGFIILGLAFWFLLLFFSIYFLKPDIGVSLNQSYVLGTPGIIFSSVLGLITITGFIVTISKLEETSVRITDYPTLQKRLTLLIRESTKGHSTFGEPNSNGKKNQAEDYSENFLRVFTRTLALGSMSTPRRIFNSYLKSLADLFVQGRSQIIQLDHYDLPDIPDGNITYENLENILTTSQVGRFFMRFKERRFSPNQIAKGYRDSILVSSKVQKIGEKCSDPNQVPSQKTSHIYAIRDHVADLPNYHLFLSLKRAIIITPLDVPIGDTNDEDNDGIGQDDEHSDQHQTWSSGPVHVVAVETTNKQVITELLTTFQMIWYKTIKT